MRVLFVPAFALVLVGAGDPPQSALDNPAYTFPPERWETIEDATEGVAIETDEGDRMGTPADPEICTDTITEAREASGQPPLLEREPASPDRPHAIYAVDRRQDGCSVMVMMGDPDDIRPLPLPSEDSSGVISARTAQVIEE